MPVLLCYVFLFCQLPIYSMHLLLTAALYIFSFSPLLVRLEGRQPHLCCPKPAGRAHAQAQDTAGGQLLQAFNAVSSGLGGQGSAAPVLSGG